MLKIKFPQDSLNGDGTKPQNLLSSLIQSSDNEGNHLSKNDSSKSIPPAKVKPKVSGSTSSLCFKINNFLLFLVGTCFIASTVLLYVIPLCDLIMSIKLRMSPALPPFQEWIRPKPKVYCSTYIFTVTNAEAFLLGKDHKIKVKEFGPIVYLEHIEHSDVVFNKNSTLTYRIRRHLEFLPELNPPGILNETITVPNIVLLGMASKIANYMFTVKMPFNMISRNDDLFVNTTVYNYLWNFTTPALDTIDNYLPFLIPTDNGGTLHMVYKDFDDLVNVNIGPKYSATDFFKINAFNYRPTAPGYRPERGDCFASVQNSTEGVIYSNSLQKDQILYYWRKSICRPVPLYFDKEVQMGNLLAYKFVTRADWYDRLDNLTTDCYKGYGDEILPDGLSDISKCYSELPLAVSSPHFYGRDGPWNDRLEGFTPSYEQHGSYAIIEPINGVAIDQIARSQSNIVLPRLNGFNANVNRFSRMVIPMIWLQYHQPELTKDLENLLILTANILPKLQYSLPVIFLILSLLSYFFFIKRINQNVSLSKYSKIKRFSRSFFNSK